MQDYRNGFTILLEIMPPLPILYPENMVHNYDKEITMERTHVIQFIQKLLAAIEKRVPSYNENPEDANIANGNVAICIIDGEGCIYGKLFGNDKIRQRASFRIAWTKASQVWLTGVKTGDYEKLVYTGRAVPEKLGLMKPDLIGWEGGQPIAIDETSALSIGFSGFRGVSDLDIVTKAIRDIR